MEGVSVHYRWRTLSGYKDVEESTGAAVMGRRREDPDRSADTGSGCICFAGGASLRRECKPDIQIVARSAFQSSAQRRRERIVPSSGGGRRTACP
jgi:hypothetical protein